MIRRALIILFIVLLSPLLLVLVLLVPVYLVLLRISQWASLRLYCLRAGRRWFFVGTARHGWFDFIGNNVLPVLPEGVEPLWYPRFDRFAAAHGAKRALFEAGFGLAKPYVARVGLWSIRCESLHKPLLPLKSRTKRDVRVQSELAEILRVHGLG